MKERLMLIAVLIAILIGPIAMLWLAHSGAHAHYHHKPTPTVHVIQA